MVNPGAFRGTRREFLMNEKPAYRTGVEGGYTPDALATIWRRYFKRYPIDLDHRVEPSPKFTAAVNDDLAEPDIEPIDQDQEPEAQQQEIARRAERGERIGYRKRVSNRV